MGKSLTQVVWKSLHLPASRIWDWPKKNARHHPTSRHATPHDDSLAFIMQLFPNYASVRHFFSDISHNILSLPDALSSQITNHANPSLFLASYFVPSTTNDSVLTSRLLFQDANINCAHLLIWDAKFSVRLPFPSLISIVFLLQFMVFFYFISCYIFRLFSLLMFFLFFFLQFFPTFFFPFLRISFFFFNYFSIHLAFLIFFSFQIILSFFFSSLYSSFFILWLYSLFLILFLSLFFSLHFRFYFIFMHTSYYFKLTYCFLSIVWCPFLWRSNIKWWTKVVYCCGRYSSK